MNRIGGSHFSLGPAARAGAALLAAAFVASPPVAAEPDRGAPATQSPRFCGTLGQNLTPCLGTISAVEGTAGYAAALWQLASSIEGNSAQVGAVLNVKRCISASCKAIGEGKKHAKVSFIPISDAHQVVPDLSDEPIALGVFVHSGRSTSGNNDHHKEYMYGLVPTPTSVARRLYLLMTTDVDQVSGLAEWSIVAVDSLSGPQYQTVEVRSGSAFGRCVGVVHEPTSKAFAGFRSCASQARASQRATSKDSVDALHGRIDNDSPFDHAWISCGLGCCRIQ